MDLVFLPATQPGDRTFGAVLDRIAAFPSAKVHRVSFPRMVWYNAAVRDEAVSQILALDLPSCVLVGFSKSGLGAWNIVRAIPYLVEATIIFDAPVARETLPPWGTGPFYNDDAAWLRDLPVRTIGDFAASVPATHRLALIGGETFHEEMHQLSGRLRDAGIEHAYHHRPDLAHHWTSGWLELGISAVRSASSLSSDAGPG